MQILYEPHAECDCFILRKEPGAPEAKWTAERVKELDDLPIQAVDEAYRNPGKWIPFEWGPHIVISVQLKQAAAELLEVAKMLIEANHNARDDRHFRRRMAIVYERALAAVARAEGREV